MKRFYFLLLLLVATLSAQAKNPISYRFGVDAGMVGSGGYSVIISPLQLQLTPSWQIGALGIGAQSYKYFSDINDVEAAAKDMNPNLVINSIGSPEVSYYGGGAVIQLLSIKYEAVGLTLGNNFVPYIKVSGYYNLANNDEEPNNNPFSTNVSNCEYEVPSRTFGDIKVGLSLYSKQRGCNLAAYIGVTYGTYTTVNIDYDVYYTKEQYGNTVEGDTRLWDWGTVKLPVLFNCGLQFEFGGGGAFGYGKYRNYTTEQRKQLRKQRTNNTLSALSALGAGLNAAGEAYGAVSNNKNIGGSSQYSSGSTSSSNKSNSSYQNEYNRWAKLAEKSYDQLTSQSMSTVTYSKKLSLFRDQQHKMKEIRKKATRDGITIVGSIYEDVDIKSY